MTEAATGAAGSAVNVHGSRWWQVPLTPSSGEQRRARWWLLIVCVGIVVLHVALAGVDRPINWDEAIHVSQVNPAVPAVFMEPHRTRGVSFLVAPIAVFDPSMVWLRLYLVLIGAAATFAAFAVWVRLIGGAVPVAAALYSSFWITVFYSVEVLPNQPSALLAVAVTGVFARGLAGVPVRNHLLWLAGLMGLFALVRPPDAAMVGIGLALLAVLARRTGQFAPLVAAAGGGASGIAAWWVEGWVRFGFVPHETVRSAGEYSVAAGRVNLLPLYLQHTETRLRCAGACVEDFVEAGVTWQLPPTRSLVFLVLAGLLVLLATVASGSSRWLVGVPLVVIAPVLAFYAYLGGVMNQRYVLLVYALALLPPAIGLRACWLQLERWPAWSRAPIRTATVVVLAITCWWSASKSLDRFDNPSTRDRAYDIGQLLSAETGRTGTDCVLAARVNYPQLQYWSGCAATSGGRAQDGELQPPLGELGSYVDLAARHAEGADLYAVDRESLPEGSPLETWERVDPDSEPIGRYVLYRAVEGSWVPVPPCPPEDRGPERRLAEVLSDGC